MSKYKVVLAPVFDETASIPQIMEVTLRFYDHESCGQCSQCREGTQWLHQIFRRIARGKGKPEDVELLVSLSNGMAPGKTICALSDAAAIPTLAAVKHFRADFEACIQLGRDPHASEAALSTATAGQTHP